MKTTNDVREISIPQRDEKKVMKMVEKTKGGARKEDVVKGSTPSTFISVFMDGYALGGRDGWIPIMKLSDTKVVDIGKFAVARHDYQAKTQLAFNNLVSGQIRSRAGTEYNMTIAAKDGNDADMLKN
ncbi:cysteine proteinase inhibitor 1-like protein [Tanacetum coccineum]